MPPSDSTELAPARCLYTDAALKLSNLVLGGIEGSLGVERVVTCLEQNFDFLECSALLGGGAGELKSVERVQVRLTLVSGR